MSQGGARVLLAYLALVWLSPIAAYAGNCPNPCRNTAASAPPQRSASPPQSASRPSYAAPPPVRSTFQAPPPVQRPPVLAPPHPAYPSAPHYQQAPAPQIKQPTARTAEPPRTAAAPQHATGLTGPHTVTNHVTAAAGTAARSHPVPPTQEHRVALSPGATMVTQPGHTGFTAIKREPAGRSIVVEQRVDAKGGIHVNAYRQTISADGRATTRVYTDGHRTIDTASFHSTGWVNGPQFVRYHNGLHAAYAPNGRPLYAEAFIHRGTTRMVQRTIYAVNESGQIRQLATPQLRYYAITPVRGYDTFVYQPVVYGAPLYALFYAPLALPIFVGPRCLICPDSRAVFIVPQTQYSDPIELVGDMQIASAVTDQGIAPVEYQSAYPDAPPAPVTSAPPVADAPPPPPELVAAAADAVDLNTLKQQTSALQAHAASRAPADPAIPASAATAPPDAALTEAALPADSLAVPEDVRGQIHKQVRLSIAEDAHAHPLGLVDIIQSGYSRIYLFQVAGAIDTVSAITGDGCALDSGDLIAFTSLGDSEQRPTAQMKVVTARPGHCLSQDMVEVSVGDLQDMLNTFNQRLEENMRKLHACASTKDGCVRT